jgi:hypothetical protein
VLVATVAALGGFSHSRSAAREVVNFVQTGSFAGSGVTGSGTGSSANDQYVETTTICHKTGSSTQPWVVQTVPTSALPAHKAHGDTLFDGSCPGPPIP